MSSEFNWFSEDPPETPKWTPKKAWLLTIIVCVGILLFITFNYEKQKFEPVILKEVVTEKKTPMLNSEDLKKDLGVARHLFKRLKQYKED